MMNSRIPLPTRSTSAFTLLEVMVSSAVIGVVMMIMLAATSASMGLWRGAEQRIAVDREGRNGFFLMSSDLQNLANVAHPDLQPLFGHWQQGVFMEFPVLRPAEYQADDNLGDACYVRYLYNADEKRIYRSHVDSAELFASLLAGDQPPTAPYEVLADNVTDIFVNTYNADGGPPGNPAEVVTVNLSVGVVDKQEAENIKKGVSAGEAKSGKQYFSVNFFVR